MHRLRQLCQLQIAVFGTNLKNFALLSTAPTDIPKAKHVRPIDISPDAFLLEIKNRRKEALNSVCIQLDIDDRPDEACSYISEFGEIKYLSSCAVTNKKKCIIVEYEDSTSAEELLNSCYNQGYDGNVPFYSNFLEFKQQKVQKVSELQKSNLKIPFEDINNLDHITFKKLREAKSISHQIEIFYDSQKLTEIEKRIRFIICQQFEQIFSGIFPQCKVLPFGSSVSGFGKHRCDLDMIWQLYSDKFQEHDRVLHFESRSMDDRKEVRISLSAVGVMLKTFVPSCSHVQSILKARVPILKFNHSYINVACDLSFSNLSGFHMSELLHLYNLYDWRVKHLVFVVRRWAADNGLTFSFPGNTITNFSWLLMVVFFFQRKGGASLSYFQDNLNQQDEINKSNPRRLHHDMRDKSYFEKSVGDLLLEFFKFYINFDFENRGMSVLLGIDIRKPEMDPLYLQNPIDTHLNVAKNVTFNQIEMIQTCMESSFNNLTITNQPCVDSSWGLCSIFKEEESRYKVKDDVYISSLLAKGHTSAYGNYSSTNSFNNDRLSNKENLNHPFLGNTSQTKFSQPKDSSLDSFVEDLSSVYRTRFPNKPNGNS